MSQSYYKYTKLASDMIRLIEIVPNVSGDSTTLVSGISTKRDMHFEEQLEIKISDWPMHECPPYVALSYTWGSPTLIPDPTASILSTVQRIYPVVCGGLIVRVTRNLRDCLRRLRHVTKVYRPLEKQAHDDQSNFSDVLRYAKYFWIDALCINQDDLNERSHQVALMRSIYQKAQMTIIWLGEEEDHFHRNDDCTPRNIPAVLKSVKEKLRIEFLSNPEERPEIELLGKERVVIADIFTRSWFSRLWVLQEAVLSWESIVLLGTNIILFDLLFLISKHIFGRMLHNGYWQHDLQSRVYLLENSGIWLYSTNTLLMLSRCRFQVRKGMLPDFISVINMGNSSECHDPRDKIYGILGIVSEFCCGGNLLLSPDYQKPVYQVYTEATLKILQHRQDLEVLRMVSAYRSSGMQQLPSWCPDFTMINTPINFSDKRKRAWRFGCPPPIYSLIDKHGLRVLGYCIDMVVETTKYSQPESYGMDQQNRALMIDVVKFCEITLRVGTTTYPKDVCGDIDIATDTDEHCSGLPVRNSSLIEMLWHTLFAHYDWVNEGFLEPDDTGLRAEIGLLFPLFIIAAITSSLPDVCNAFLYTAFPTPQRDNMLSVFKNLEESEYLKRLDELLMELAKRDVAGAIYLPDPGRFGDWYDDFHETYNKKARSVNDTFDFRFRLGLFEQTSLQKRARTAGLKLSSSMTQPKIKPTEEHSDLAGASQEMLKMHEWVSYFTAVFKATSQHPYFFRTAKGTLGLSRHRIENGDQIWILGGAYTPVCLRKKPSGCYQFLGEAYVHGVVAGEIPNNCKEPRSITLE